MTFAVKWHRQAIRQLAAAYMAALAVGRGTAVTAASAQIDVLLAHDPDTRGESREGRKRVLFVAPLVVDFVVQPQRQRVVVRGLRYHELRHP
jgi:hypothetical protein